jgi:hypothetical protein
MLKSDTKTTINLKHLICPITSLIYLNPVIIEDGFTYERDEIVKWLKHNDSSPMTRMIIRDKKMFTNHSIKQQVNEYLSSNPDEIIHQYNHDKTEYQVVDIVYNLIQNPTQNLTQNPSPNNESEVQITDIETTPNITQHTYTNDSTNEIVQRNDTSTNNYVIIRSNMDERNIIETQESKKNVLVMLIECVKVCIGRTRYILYNLRRKYANIIEIISILFSFICVIVTFFSSIIIVNIIMDYIL